MFRSSPPGVDPRCLYDNKVRDAVKRMRRERKRRGQRGRGRPKKSACQRRGPTRKEPANFVFGHRHLIVTKDENLSDQQRADLPTMFQDLLLQTLRNFVDKVSRRFEAQQSPHQAHCHRAVLLTNGVYAAIPELGDGDAGGGQVRQEDRLPPHVARASSWHIAANSLKTPARDSHQ